MQSGNSRRKPIAATVDFAAARPRVAAHVLEQILKATGGCTDAQSGLPGDRLEVLVDESDHHLIPTRNGVERALYVLYKMGFVALGSSGRIRESSDGKQVRVVGDLLLRGPRERREDDATIARAIAGWLVKEWRAEDRIIAREGKAVRA